jgi:hypothetical protein
MRSDGMVGTVNPMTDLDSQRDATTERRRRGGDRNVFGLVLIGLGTVWFLSETHLLALSAETILSVLLILLALGLIYTARWGRRMGRWPILLGIALTFALVANSPSLHFRGGFGDPTYAPTSQTDLLPEYRGGFGNLTLDLTGIPNKDLEGQHVNVHMGGGNVTVIVNSDVALDLVGRVRFGHLQACGQDLGSGIGGQARHYRNAPKNATAYLWLTINAGAGNAQVQCPPPATPATAATTTTSTP